MALKPSNAKITDFETSFDAVPVASPEGDVIWADVRIDYILSGLTPTVTIRVPVPWNERDTPEERKSKALRGARQLIDHACRAAGVAAAETERDASTAQDVLDAVTPPRACRTRTRTRLGNAHRKAAPPASDRGGRLDREIQLGGFRTLEVGNGHAHQANAFWVGRTLRISPKLIS